MMNMLLEYPLLANPLIQSAGLPIVVVALLSYIIDKIRQGWASLAALLAFFGAALLIAGARLWPLTSVRKILLVGLVMAVVVIIANRWRGDARMRRNLLAVITVSASLWIYWPLLIHQQDRMVWLLALGAAAYVSWLVLATTELNHHNLRATVAIMMLALVTSLIAINGASAMIGQLAAVIAAATGTLIMMHSLRLISLSRFEFLLPLLIIVALLGVAAVAYARLPAASLMCLMALPLTMRFVPSSISRLLIGRPWLQAAYYVVVALPVMVGAIYLAQSTTEVTAY